MKQFLKKYKFYVAGIFGVTGTLAGILNYAEIVPEPIEVFNLFGTIILITGIIISFVFHSKISKWIKHILIFLSLNFFILMIFQTFFISNVEYDDGHKTYVFHGLEINKKNLEGLTHTEIIKAEGKEYEYLDLAYKNYGAWVLSYQILLYLFSMLFIMSFAGVISLKDN